MKTIWKVLMGAAAVAAVAPYQVKKDEETGTVELKAATWSGTYTRNGSEKNLTVRPLPGILKSKECECCEDECGSCCEDEAPVEEDAEITIEVREEPAEEEETKTGTETEDKDTAEEEPKPEEA